MVGVTTQLKVAGTERPLSAATEVVLLRAAQVVGEAGSGREALRVARPCSHRRLQPSWFPGCVERTLSP